jgi:hypothetical protein
MGNSPKEATEMDRDAFVVPVKTIVIIFIAIGALALAMTSPALAAQGAAPDSECQVGADNQHIEEWQLLSSEEFALFITDEFNIPSDIAPLIATATYNNCDRNGDDYACVMVQNLPNDANGSSKWWLVEDNHPFGGK